MKIWKFLNVYKLRSFWVFVISLTTFGFYMFQNSHKLIVSNKYLLEFWLERLLEIKVSNRPEDWYLNPYGSESHMGLLITTLSGSVIYLKHLAIFFQYLDSYSFPFVIWSRVHVCISFLQHCVSRNNANRLKRV